MGAPVSAQAGGPGTYTSEAQKAAGYIDSHSGDLTKGDLGLELDGALALISAGKTDSPTLAKVKDDIKAKGPTYCTDVKVGACAKLTITLLAAGESTTYGGFDYANPVTSATEFKEHPMHQALDMIAFERLGKPIPYDLFKSVIDYAFHGLPEYVAGRVSTDGVMLTALSHVVATSDQQKTLAAAKASLMARLDAAKVGDAWTFSGEGNVRATTRVAPGLYRAGDAGHQDQAVKGQAWLAKQQKENGSFPGAVVTPAWTMMATVQAVPALLGLQSFDNIGAYPAGPVSVDGGAWTPPRRLMKMTVLGDSYSAGNGTLKDGYPADGSYRSPKNYGFVLMRNLNREFQADTTFQTDVRAWSGARIATGDHNIVGQADTMDPHTSVVLMTAGGNDLDFSNVVENCFLEAAHSANHCGDSVDAARKKIDATMKNTTTLLSHVQNRLADPADTRVILIGYPYLISANRDTPGSDLPSTRVRAAEDEFTARQAATIKAWNKTHALKVIYAPTTTLFNTHEPRPSIASIGSIGLQNDYRWINGLFETAGRLGDDGKTHADQVPPSDEYKPNFYHPNVIGHEQIAGMVHNALLFRKARSVESLPESVAQLAAVPGVRMRAAVVGQSRVSQGSRLTLDASSSYTAFGHIRRWQWDLDGDGHYETTTRTPEINRTLTRLGKYHARLRITDDSGASDTLTFPLEVVRRSEDIPGTRHTCPTTANHGQSSLTDDGFADTYNPDTTTKAPR
ncbi:PKD domain-containing protein [Cutibacterium equinum]|uniref:PKD domain-containing protein n=1 Tax=Cutibacterium equinum TaxID=3016342 RepID=A0ABY7R1H1_9ACTN|nr:PKD domain-containing protein [Cutibacterium equinum]WCC81156.1 PKD domain-containing protein [Cutibacterium equinum]